jgi:hypothetical protein
MAIERKWGEIAPVAFTADGEDIGKVTVTDTFCFKVKMIVIVKADGKEPKRYQVKRVSNETEMFLGPEQGSLKNRSDLSSYTMAINPTVQAPEQARPEIPPADYERAVYEEEPTVAKRVFNVDKYGHPYTLDNPFPVDVVFNVDTIEFNNPNRQFFEKLNIPAKNIEVSFLFPNNTKWYQIKARGYKDVIKVGLSAGAIASGDYWEIAFGNSFTPEELVDFPNGYRLYFESKHKNNVDLEILYYRKV